MIERLQDSKDTTHRAIAMGRGTLRIDSLPELGRALEELWADRGARRAWALALVRAAAHRLPPGDWIIEYPPGWPEPERRTAAELAMEEAGVLPGFVADPQLTAGLRLVAGDSVLDASPAGLLSEDGRLSAALQYELANAPLRLL